jgi:hypothetical protein
VKRQVWLRVCCWPSNFQQLRAGDKSIYAMPHPLLIGNNTHIRIGIERQ